MPSYPTSDHCDGERFFNPDDEVQRSPRDLIRWWRTRERGAWPHALPRAQAAPPMAVDAPGMAATWIGHSTLLLQAGGVNILTDPVFTSHAGPYGRFGPRRVRPPAAGIADLPPIALVAVSHNHYDHLQPGSLRALQERFAPAFVTTLGNGRFLARQGLARVTELDWWGETTAAGVEVMCTPARHFAARTPFDRNRTLWGGFVFRVAGATLYFAGDTGYGREFAAIGARVPGIDLACIPIGAYDPRWFMRPVHVDPEEALRIHQDVGARVSVGMHFGTFRLTDEPFEEPGLRLARARQSFGLPPEAFVVPEPGQTIVLR
jgi:L-ascorbate metabolism protein UlaG (beta-lactamase superfamily)